MFERHFRPQTVPVTTDCRHGELPAVTPKTDRAVMRGRITVNVQPVPPLGVADIGNRRVVVLTPEEWHRVEAFAQAEHVAGSNLTLALRDDPVLNADVLSGQ